MWMKVLKHEKKKGFDLQINFSYYFIFVYFQSEYLKGWVLGTPFSAKKNM